MFILIIFGIGLGLGLAFGAAPLLTPSHNDWQPMAKALLRDLRQPSDQFYWLPKAEDEFHVLVKFNNFGLHAPDYTLKKPAGVFRILVVGDSFPQGIQVEIEQGFPWLIQQQLNRSNPGRKIEVINLSVDAYGTDRELLLYALLGWQFEPDMVVLSVYAGNDIQDNDIDLETRRYGRRLDRPFFTLENGQMNLHNSPVFSPILYPHQPVFKWLTDMQARQSPPPPANPPERPTVIKTEPYTLEYPVEMGVYLPEDGHWKNAWALTEKLLLEFRTVTGFQNIPLAVVIIPDRRAVHDEDWTDTRSQYESVQPALMTADVDAPANRLEKWLTTAHIPVLNLTTVLRSWARSNPQGRAYFRGDGHFTPDGHAVSANRIAGWLRASGLVPG
jgi:lysophospholipase L1-like esterase